MRLSVDRINRESPYWVIQLDDMTFRFVTKNGIIYRVGFYKDQYFLGNRAYHFFISNDNNANPPKNVIYHCPFCKKKKTDPAKAIRFS